MTTRSFRARHQWQGLGQLGGGALPQLPAESTVFVGRRRELAEVKRALTTRPLVTITGIGGVGKTRLA